MLLKNNNTKVESENIKKIDKKKEKKEKKEKINKNVKNKAYDVNGNEITKKQFKLFKKEKKKLIIPKTVQQTIPYIAVYDEGIIETKQGVFTKSYFLQDVNYQIAKQEDQEDMFIRYGELLNSFAPDVEFEITINNKNINIENFEKNVLLKTYKDNLDIYRNEYNDMLRKNISEGKNNLTRDKYLTVAVNADSYENALVIFSRIDTEIATNIKKIGDATCKALSTTERLEILHNIYNLGDDEANFNRKIQLDGIEVKNFDLKWLKKLGITTKDIIGPMSFEFKKDYMLIGNKYARVIFLSNLPTYLSDKILAEITNVNFNMLTSVNISSVRPDKAINIVKNQMVNINSNMIDRQKRASKSGYSIDLISPELKHAQEEAEELMQDLTSKNQKMFLTTFTITHFADSLEQLNSQTEIILNIGRKFLCEFKKLNWQQENGLTTTLPLAYNKLSIKRTLTTNSTSIFMPFVSQELVQRNGMYYGLNAISRNLILFNRKNSKNGNGFILGTPGSGKSFSAKREMLNVALSTNDDIIVIDPEREYGKMAEILGGQVINIAVGSKYHINPMDIDENYAGEDNPITLKSDFVLSLCETILGGRYGLSPVQTSIIDRCCRDVYSKFMETYKEEDIPTLRDFQKILECQPEREAREIAIALEIYTKGSLDVFAHKTNVETNNRFVVYDIKDIGTNIKTMAMLIVLDNIWNKIVSNKNIGRNTWIYIDEIYLLFTNETSAQFLKQLYKRARKWGGIPTGITQNVEDLLKSETARTMISNCEFIQMLNQAPLDRAELASLLNISEQQLSYITNANAGQGLLYTGSSIIPFIDKFPTDTKLYQAMTTKLDEIK